MRISALVENTPGQHHAAVETNGQQKSISIPPKPEGVGSAVNGGELLFLALATCYCNDLYREAASRGLSLSRVSVEVNGEFGGPGEPASNIEYCASVESNAPREEVLALMRHTDTVAEIQNTLRAGRAVSLREIDAVSRK